MISGEYINTIKLQRKIIVVFHIYLYTYHNSLSMQHGITSPSGQLLLEGEMGEEGASTLLSFCLYQVDIIVVV